MSPTATPTRRRPVKPSAAAPTPKTRRKNLAAVPDPPVATRAFAGADIGIITCRATHRHALSPCAALPEYMAGMFGQLVFMACERCGVVRRSELTWQPRPRLIRHLYIYPESYSLGRDGRIDVGEVVGEWMTRLVESGSVVDLGKEPTAKTKKARGAA